MNVVRAATQSVQPARLELPLLDPKGTRELGLVAAYLLEEALCVLAADERLYGVTERGLERSSRITYTRTTGSDVARCGELLRYLPGYLPHEHFRHPRHN